MRRLDGITDSVDMGLSKLPEIVKERDPLLPRSAVVHGITESDVTYQLYNNGISIFNILRNFCSVLHSG